MTLSKNVVNIFGVYFKSISALSEQNSNWSGLFLTNVEWWLNWAVVKKQQQQQQKILVKIKNKKWLTQLHLKI